MKKSIALVYKIVIVIALMLVFATVAYANQIRGELEFYVDEANGECAVLGIGTYTGTEIVIPETYGGYPVTRIEEKAFYDNANITKLVVPSSVKSIGAFAFHYCVSLESVEIGDGVEAIEDSAFYFCTQLDKLELGESVKTIERYAFYNCTDLDYLTIPNSVEVIEDAAFKYCTSLIQLTLGQGVKAVGNEAFKYCYKLFELYNLSNIEVSVGGEDNSFLGKYLTIIHITKDEPSILIPGQDGYVFANIGGLYALICQVGEETELKLPNDINGEKYIIYKFAFSNRTGLKSIYFGTGVTAIGRAAFNICGSLEKVVMNEGVTQIGSLVFNDCHSLKSVQLPETVTEIGTAAFQNCYELQGIKLTNGIKSIEENTFLNCYKMRFIIFPEAVTKIGPGAFSECDALTNITIPKTLDTIGRGAFLGCEALKSVYIHKDVSTISEYAFYDCPKLTIYCEADSAPSGWDKNWNKSECPVEWGLSVTLDKMLVFLGYSTNGTRVCSGYSIDKNLFNFYKVINGEKVEFGVVFASYELLAGRNPLDESCQPIALDRGRVIKCELSDEDYISCDLVLSDITPEQFDHRFVMSGYTFDGVSIKYIQGEISETVTGVSYNEIMAELEGAGMEDNISILPL